MPRRSVVPYVGGKSYHASWIIEHFPDHTRYVECFGGSASVLLNKPESLFEVYNDLDGDVANFFEVLRDRPDDLVEFLTPIDYSRSRFDDWREAFYGPEGPPSDPVERAGMYFFLHLASHVANSSRVAGMKTTGQGSPAKTLINKREALDDFAERFEGVVIENQDYKEIVERYDGAAGHRPDRTLFYFDPPYLLERSDNYYKNRGFDHEAFAETLADIESRFVISYGNIPEAVGELDLRVVEKPAAYQSGRTQDSGDDAAEDERMERLLMNFDPDETPRFVDGQQRTLDRVLAED